jgi:hypothetical protein
MKPLSNGTSRSLLLLLLAATTLPSLGCLAAGLAVAGVAGAGAGAYTYIQGRLVRDYPAGLPDTLQATQNSLAELGFPILKREGTDTAQTLTTETSTGVKVTIDLSAQNSPIPAYGAMTRVGVRVGMLGDETTSMLILDRIPVYLVPAARGPRPGTAPGALQPVAAQVPLQPVPPGGAIPVREEAASPGRLQPQPAPNWR